MSQRFILNEVSYFGAGARKELPEVISRMNRHKALVCSDKGLIKVGNHPVLSAYLNFHLKHTRFYIMASHFNYSKEGGTTFGAPHYPINPFNLRLGLSWNFFN